jgi:hypothetical protein
LDAFVDLDVVVVVATEAPEVVGMALALVLALTNGEPAALVVVVAMVSSKRRPRRT